MPQIFRVGPYLIYFWANEGGAYGADPRPYLEGVPSQNSTKVWITRSGKCLLANNNSKIPSRALRIVMQVIEARNREITEKWTNYFGEISYFC